MPREFKRVMAERQKLATVGVTASPDPRGFIKVPRATPPERDPVERVKDYGEIYKVLPEPELKRQASRCMGCGVPFCNHACPPGT